MSSPIHFIDSQNGEDNLQDTPVRTLGKRYAVQRNITPKSVAESLPATSTESQRNSSRRSAEKPKLKTTPTARLRHDDSQIHFAAIASSSPFAPEAHETQLLTERQKEVKERQSREAAAFFPDIGSSPRARSRNEDGRSPPKLFLSGNHRSHANLDSDDDASPELLSDDALMKDVFGSSPTPRSNKRVTLDLGSDFEPPSSPQSLPTTVPPVVVADQQSAPSPPASQTKQDQVESTIPEEQIRPQTQEHYLPDTVPVVVPHDEEINISKQPETADDNARSKSVPKKLNADDYNQPDVSAFSDVDMFVDAPSEPVEETPATEDGIKHGSADAHELIASSEHSSSDNGDLISSPEHNMADAEDPVLNPPGPSDADPELNPGGSDEQIATPLETHSARVPNHEVSSIVDETSHVMDSFCDESISFYSNEDDQIAAQLVNDLERASQQASPQKNEKPGADSQPKKRGRKRKNESGNSRATSKRAKGVPSTQGIEVVVETRRPGDSNDCVIIDSRPAMNIVSPLPKEVKQERSPSPSGDIRAVATAHEAKVDPLRRTRSSTAGATIVQNPPLFSMKRKFATDKLKSEPDDVADNITAPPSRKRRSARLSQASTDSPQIEAISSGEEYKNSAEVLYDKISPDFSPRDRDSQGRSGSHFENMDETGDDAHQGATPPSPGADISGGAAPPPLANEALSRALNKRARPAQTQEANSPQNRGWTDSSLDEGERKLKRKAEEGGRHVKDQDTGMQHDDNPEGVHAPRSSARGLLGSLRQWLGDIKQAVLAPEEEREIVSLMFESVREVHEAGRRKSGA